VTANHSLHKATRPLVFVDLWALVIRVARQHNGFGRASVALQIPAQQAFSYVFGLPHRERHDR
jgi:hypothetical protein